MHLHWMCDEGHYPAEALSSQLDAIVYVQKGSWGLCSTGLKNLTERLKSVIFNAIYHIWMQCPKTSPSPHPHLPSH